MMNTNTINRQVLKFPKPFSTYLTFYKDSCTGGVAEVIILELKLGAGQHLYGFSSAAEQRKTQF
jgi:hypothetical protein